MQLAELPSDLLPYGAIVCPLNMVASLHGARTRYSCVALEAQFLIWKPHCIPTWGKMTAWNRSDCIRFCSDDRGHIQGLLHKIAGVLINLLRIGEEEPPHGIRFGCNLPRDYALRSLPRVAHDDLFFLGRMTQKRAPG